MHSLSPQIAKAFSLAKAGSLRPFRAELLLLKPAEIAELLENLTPREQLAVFRLLPLENAIPTFEYLKVKVQRHLLQSLNAHKVADILNHMAPDDRTALLGHLPSTAVKELITLLSEKERRITLALLGYPEDSVGRLMTPDYIEVEQEWSVQQVLDYVREHGSDSETLSVVYVTDDKGILIDDIKIREFLLAPLSKKVHEIMDHQFVSIKARQDQEQALEVFRTHDRSALPVTDEQGVLMGIVTIDDMLEVQAVENTEDFQMLGGTEALSEPYLRIPLLKAVQKRGGWLVILLLGEMLTATAMSYFEDEIAKAVVLALFVPLIISSGGNSGSQATTLIIRAMALGEVRLGDWWKVFSREIVVGSMLGLLLGFIGFLRIMVWQQVFNPYGPHWLPLAFTVGFSLTGVVLWGSLAGSMLPLLLRKLRLDPATASAPFVATLVDVTGLIIYFSFAFLLLRGTML
jgi:magnesium transporter